MENKSKALVIQTVNDSAVLLFQGGQILRIKNVSGWKVGEEILYDAILPMEDNQPKQKPASSRMFMTIMKAAACILLLFSGLYASREIPVHSEQLSECIEVKTNIYGKVINAKPLSSQGEQVLELIESGDKGEEYKTDSVTDYRDTVQKVLSELEAGSPISVLAGSDDFTQYYDEIPEDLKQKAEEAIANGDQEAIDDVSEEIKNQVTVDLYRTSGQELQLAYDLFGYKTDRDRFYSYGNEGHSAEENDTGNKDGIYIPFWAINMQQDIMPVTDAINLGFDYTKDDTIPEFDNATIFLYDLTDNIEVNSSVKDCAREDYSRPDAGNIVTSMRVYIDAINAVPYHTFYVKVNDVILDGNEIDNICYVFKFVPGGSEGFRYWNETGTGQYSPNQDKSNQDNSSQGTSSQGNSNPDKANPDNSTVIDKSNEVIEWKDASVEAIVRQALGKETGDITKKEAEQYKDWLILYRADIKTIEDLVWFTNITWLYVRADLIKDAGIFQSDTKICIFFDGLNGIADIYNNCNISELSRIKWLGVILKQDDKNSRYVLGEAEVSLEFENSFSDFYGIEALLELNNICYLNLSDNYISDIKPLGCLTGLSSLTDIWLDNNYITDISILKDFRNLNLNFLSLDNNWIEDISSLSNLNNLNQLSLDGNKLTDISAIGSLTNLLFISLGDNKISDISCFVNLNPRTINLRNNKIKLINCFENMGQLLHLNLSDNLIIDISDLEYLNYDTQLFLENNPIIDWSPVSHVEQVTGRPNE